MVLQVSMGKLNEGSWYGCTALTVVRNTYTFESIYANTSSSNHAIVVQFASATKKSSLKITDSLEQITKTVSVPASQKSVSSKLALSAGGDNKLVIESSNTIKSIEIQAPAGKYYPCTEFSISGSAKIETCDSGFCKPTGSKLSYINSSNKGSANIQVTLPASSKNETILKYIEVDFTNNDIALSTSWGLGSNSRNITISVNDDKPVRLEVPLSGKHSELFGPGKGWWDTSTLGLLVGGWKSGDNIVVVGNEAGDDSFQSYGADFVGLKVFD